MESAAGINIQWLVNLLVLGLACVLWYLLRQKDTSQENQITDLYKKHEDDSIRLQLLELKIAQDHYPKSELNFILGTIQTAFKDGVHEISTKLDVLNNNFLGHIMQDRDKQ